MQRGGKSKLLVMVSVIRIQSFGASVLKTARSCTKLCLKFASNRFILVKFKLEEMNNSYLELYKMRGSDFLHTIITFFVRHCQNLRMFSCVNRF
jgi:hypothetical protein